MNKITTYLKETQGELKHVSWPSRREALAYTSLVIGISLLVAFYLGLFDYLFSFILEKIVL